MSCWLPFAGCPVTGSPSPATGNRSPATDSSPSTGSSIMRHLDDLAADDHRPEVVPAGADYLRDMNDEENDVADGEPEVEKARHRVSAEEPCQPRKLHRLVDRETGEQRAESHQHDGGVGNLLRAVVLPLRRRLSPQM